MRALPSVLALFAWVNAARFGPLVQIRSSVDDLAAKAIESWPDPPMSPLRQLFAVAQKVKFGIA
jgi:hypothetical protein